MGDVFLCGVDGSIEFPDLGEASYGCCWGTAIRGPEHCTCWEPEYDLEQLPISDADSPMPMPRAEMCGDCAFRPDSPERNGDEGYENNGGLDDLTELVDKGQPFYCHQGMRRIVRWRHPSGAAADDHPGNYAPPMATIANAQIPFKADGTPGDICAGWWARSERQWRRS
jgi:hypothetical protein